ncbi:GNAT family N-acetyltransferase [Wenzhouxiangella marina]|uniref:GNAT family acetyltransferase n=1 Tax=Wenzhouxiangella marina TaxID=1579979 RepID=A0A0K0XU15_9GAMM|nr:GNAT family N-acetyltransferase [Wenzhouxiangella marina]AKS41155.1 GNAT family acetyltransferase [Wenzhouxiangella marina]MBB6088034.1 putative acetyltransferase [Wenzhouxiangella marina]
MASDRSPSPPRVLIDPTPRYEASYLRYLDELGQEERYPFPLDFDASDFSALLVRLDDLRAGRNLPEGRVPSSTYWLVEGDEIIGVSNLRHALNEAIREVGGHIGLGVRPSRRGEGLGSELMALTIGRAWQRGMAELYIHCYRDNAASARMIRANGGQLHSEIEVGQPPRIVQRYRVGKGCG